MDYKQIETFLQVIRDRNMTKAAEKLFITQSTVSYRIKTLEEELGFALIERRKGTTQVNITDAGTQFAPLAEEWLRLYDKTQEFCRKQTVVRLRIAAPDSVHYMYHERYKKIRAESNVKLSLITANSDQITTLLKSGQADLGFSFLQSGDKDVFCDIEEQYPIVAFVRNGSSGKAADSDIKELDHSRMIQIKCVGRDNPDTGGFFKDYFGNAPEPMAQYDNLSSIIMNTEEGDWGIIPDTFIDRSRHNNEITILDIDKDKYNYNLYRIERTGVPGTLERVINRYF